MIPDKTSKATVLLFLQVDCPISNRYSPEYNRLVKQYAGKVHFFGIYCDDAVSQSDATKHGAEFGYKFPLVVDHERKLQSALGVTVTPEAVVISPDGRILYRGRIDNRYERVGIMRSEVTERDLEGVLQEIIADGSPSPRFTKASGCDIPPRSNQLQH